MLVVIGEWFGVLPWHAWHAGVAAVMVATMVVQTIARAFVHSERERLLHPHHVREVAEALGEITGGGDAISVAETSRGVLISGGATSEERQTVLHYSFSMRDSPMSDDAAQVLASLVTQLLRVSVPTELRKGEHGVYHLVIREPAPPAAQVAQGSFRRFA